VNAVTHRDYASNASVQVMLFADRLEVWNPGELPPSLTLDELRQPHASIPRNPLIDDEHFRKAYLQPALDAGLIEMTVPDKPRSTRQKYRLTAKGVRKGPKGT